MRACRHLSVRRVQVVRLAATLQDAVWRQAWKGSAAPPEGCPASSGWPCGIWLPDHDLAVTSGSEGPVQGFLEPLELVAGLFCRLGRCLGALLGRLLSSPRLC